VSRDARHSEDVLPEIKDLLDLGAVALPRPGDVGPHLPHLGALVGAIEIERLELKVRSDATLEERLHSLHVAPLPSLDELTHQFDVLLRHRLLP
jgi:hypothetical protein